MPRQRKNQENPRTQQPPHAAQSTAQREPTEEEIRLRAYEIYLARGGAPGDEVADWLQAEQALRARGKDS